MYKIVHLMTNAELREWIRQELSEAAAERFSACLDMFTDLFDAGVMVQNLNSLLYDVGSRLRAVNVEETRPNQYLWEIYRYE